ncbi:hypothetical protein GALMADRAFT_138509 [Galerina marginata CBS 339.88]|uniref:Uncharacterized protein n=1 Tax=Galerina marginata (strain CBS 339.88) TaxID=685588 RepID=A0A067SE19_GALM3|nr:hypothetical protein GALMADRAFT_149095 [Galerina marginata CBS 339.88]KDR77388.1 hypothetical protein GALMADRAFT_138509 [Galerina marginata CBS 339.88]
MNAENTEPQAASRRFAFSPEPIRFFRILPTASFVRQAFARGDGPPNRRVPRERQPPPLRQYHLRERTPRDLLAAAAAALSPPSKPDAHFQTRTRPENLRATRPSTTRNPNQQEKDRCGDKAPNRSSSPKTRRPRKPKIPLPLEMWADP